MLLFWVVQPQAVSADGNDEVVCWIDHREAVSQPPDEGVQRLIGNVERFFIPPDFYGQFSARDDPLIMFVEHFQEFELRNRQGWQNLCVPNPNLTRALLQAQAFFRFYLGLFGACAQGHGCVATDKNKFLGQRYLDNIAILQENGPARSFSIVMRSIFAPQVFQDNALRTGGKRSVAAGNLPVGYDNVARRITPDDQGRFYHPSLSVERASLADKYGNIFCNSLHQ